MNAKYKLALLKVVCLGNTMEYAKQLKEKKLLAITLLFIAWPICFLALMGCGTNLKILNSKTKHYANL